MQAKTVKILLALFLLQLGAIFYWHAFNIQTETNEPKELFSLDWQSLRALKISETDRILELTKSDNEWQLATLEQIPADPNQVSGLLTRIKNLNKSWPIAITEQAAKRFKVTDDEYQAKIEFETDSNTTKTLYIGTSPSFKKFHARIKGDNEIFLISIPDKNISANISDWVDPKYLHLELESIQEISTPQLKISRDADVFKLVNAQGDYEDITNEQNLEKLLMTISKLEFNEVLEEEHKFSMDESSKIMIQFSEKPPVEIKILNKKEDKIAIIETSKNSAQFKVSQKKLEQVLQLSKKDLLLDMPNEENES